MAAYQVLIADPTYPQLNAMKAFIEDSKLDLITIDGVDVSDVSMTNDIIYEYIFGNEQHALLFTLKWK